MRGAALVAALWLLCAALPAAAQSPSVSHSLWVVSGSSVMLRYTLPRSTARQLAGPRGPDPVAAAVGRYVLSHMSVTAAGRDCPASDQGYDIGTVDPLYAGADLYSFEIFFQCARPQDLTLHDRALFDRVPGHTDFAIVQVNQGRSIRRLVTARTQLLRIPDDGSLRDSGLLTYARTGFSHFVFGFDHLCFICGLLLVVRRRLEFANLAVGLALGYGVAAVLATAGVLAPRQAAPEAWIGFMVLFVALLIVAQETRSPRGTALAGAGGLLLLALAAAVTRHVEAAGLLLGAGIFAASFLQAPPVLRAGSALWILPTAAFGFLDGFTLPTDLSVLHAPTLLPTPAVFGFNVGALLAAALVAGLLLAAERLLRRTERSIPDLAVKDLSAAALAGLGSFWLLTGLGG
jgi:HupE / UreJ protein